MIRQKRQYPHHVGRIVEILKIKTLHKHANLHILPKARKLSFNSQILDLSQELMAMKRVALSKRRLRAKLPCLKAPLYKEVSE